MSAFKRADIKRLWDELRSHHPPLWIREMLALGSGARRDTYGDYPAEEERQVSLSKYPFEPGTLVKVRPRKPYKGTVDVELHDKQRWPPRNRRKGPSAYAYGDARRVPGWGFWTVVERDHVPGVGFWHKLVRGDGEMGWVEDLQKDFVVCKEETPDIR